MSDNDKNRIIIEQFQKALQVGKETKTSGEIIVRVKLHEGGIRDGRLTIERQIAWRDSDQPLILRFWISLGGRD